MKPISVGIAAFNEENTIVTTIRSILDQKYSDDLEILVCANGCYDATEEVIRSAFGSDIRLIKVPVANKAIAWRGIQDLASHNTLIYADADIVLAPDSLKRIVEVFEEHSLVTVVGGMGLAHTDGRSYSTRILHPFPKKHRYFQGALYGMDRDAFHKRRRVKNIPNMGCHVINEDSWVAAVAGESLQLTSSAQFVYSPPNLIDLIGVEARIRRGNKDLLKEMSEPLYDEEIPFSVIAKLKTFLSQKGVNGKRDLLAHKVLQSAVSFCAKYGPTNSWNRAESSKRPISYEDALSTINLYRELQNI